MITTVRQREKGRRRRKRSNVTSFSFDALQTLLKTTECYHDDRDKPKLSACSSLPWRSWQTAENRRTGEPEQLEREAPAAKHNKSEHRCKNTPPQTTQQQSLHGNNSSERSGLDQGVPLSHRLHDKAPAKSCK